MPWRSQILPMPDDGSNLRLNKPIKRERGKFVPLLGGAASNTSRGANLFENCAACHSLEPNKNMTGIQRKVQS
jgi:mono/diheme cytochrome c family protein